MSAVPSNADPLAFFPNANARAKFIDNTCDLVSGDARVLDTGPTALFRKRVAMADSASLHANSDVTGGWVRNFSFDKLEIRSGRANLDNFHFGHGESLIAALKFIAGFWMRGDVSPLEVNADYLGNAALLWKFQC